MRGESALTPAGSVPQISASAGTTTSNGGRWSGLDAQHSVISWWYPSGAGPQPAGSAGRIPSDTRAPKMPKNLPWKCHFDYNSTACPATHETAYRTKGKKV